MQRTASSDCLTVIAFAFIAYAGINVCHEIIGHCGMAALLDTRCKLISSTNIPLPVSFYPQMRRSTKGLRQRYMIPPPRA
jgi:hypothetical protein